MNTDITVHDRLLIYRKALDNLKRKKFINNGLCWLLSQSRTQLGIKIDPQSDEYECYDSALTEYGLFFDNDKMGYLPGDRKDWNTRQTIIELCIAMAETELSSHITDYL